MNKKQDIAITITVYAALLAIIAVPATAIWAFRSSMEARAYNRVTGSNVTTWEAMWIELRVQADPTR